MAGFLRAGYLAFDQLLGSTIPSFWHAPWLFWQASWIFGRFPGLWQVSWKQDAWLLTSFLEARFMSFGMLPGFSFGRHPGFLAGSLAFDRFPGSRIPGF